jgi:hypothetical protein
MSGLPLSLSLLLFMPFAKKPQGCIMCANNVMYELADVASSLSIILSLSLSLSLKIRGTFQSGHRFGELGTN